MKKLFKGKTLFIENGVMLEEVRDIFADKGAPIRWGYDETYNEDDEVYSGYLHYGKVVYLSKEKFGKTEMTYEEFKNN